MIFMYLGKFFVYLFINIVFSKFYCMSRLVILLSKLIFVFG